MGTCSLMGTSCSRSGRPRCWVNPKRGMGLGVNEVVRNQMITVVEMIIMMKMMKIIQDEKAREEETRTPEWIRNPSIQVAIIQGGG